MKNILIIAIIIVCLFTSGCTKRTDSDISNFEITFGYGLGGVENYTIEFDDDLARISYDFQSEDDYKSDWLEVPKDNILSDLNKLVKDYDIFAWNGFKKSGSVYDGAGFYINIEFEDETTITADGYGGDKYFPKNYKKVKDAFFEIINEYLDKMDL
jgi:hypothetical protein